MEPERETTPSSNKNIQLVIGIIIALAIIALGAWFVIKKGTLDANPTPTASSTEATTTDSGNNSTSTTPTGIGSIPGATVSVLPDTPSLTAAVSYGSTVSADQKNTLASQIAAERTKLTADATLYNDWLTIGILYKDAGDYNKAIEAWNYAHALIPKEATPLDNIGNLYMYETHDYVKAEAAYMAGIKAEPTFALTYRDLYELYTAGVYKTDSTAAIDIVLQGIKANPTSLDLLSLAGNYYKAKGDMTNAKKYYTEARDAAHAAGDTKAESDFNTELSSL
jgi:hypothetical protein